MNCFCGEIILSASTWTHLPVCGIYGNLTLIGTRYQRYQEERLHTFRHSKSSTLEKIVSRKYTEIRSYWQRVLRYHKCHARCTLAQSAKDFQIACRLSVPVRLSACPPVCLSVREVGGSHRKLIARAISFLCDPPTARTDRQTGGQTDRYRQTTCNLKIFSALR